VITDVQEHRLALAKKCGIKNTINSKNMSLKEVMANLNMTEGFDVGLEMSGNAQALKNMIEFVRGGAKIALLGIFPAELTLEWNQIVLKGLTLKGIYGRQMFETWYKMCSLLQSGVNIKPIITHRFSYKDFQKGFEAMASGKSGKVILDWRNS
ncbi:MAG: zinc-binding dehydrogenase, partial [Bdellovibrio sp.]|nr:zinc-binding dehydrogenase [Bdellovibrio sp.]